jgi:glycosyltransferase involved in cell wall biosynthesis
MKILMLTPYLPFPPSSGGQIRSYNLIKYLSKKHEITLFSLIKDDSERKYIRELKNYCRKIFVFKRSKSPWTIRNIVLTGFGPYPFLVIRNLAPEEKDSIAKELAREKYDLIHAETFYVMPHIPETKIPILLVEQTIEYLVYKHYVDSLKNPVARAVLGIDVGKLKYWEKVYWRKAKQAVAVSEADKKEMLVLAPRLTVDIVPNGVNLDFFKAKSSWQSKNPRVLFVANFKWLQNIEAAEILIKQVFPHIEKVLRNVELWIVGQHVPKEVSSLAGGKVIVENLEESDQEGIRNAYYQASVFVSPLHGPGGTRLKHFGAMAAKLPLVTTSVGAEGLGAKDEENILIRNSSKELAMAAIQVLKNPQLAKDLADNARAHVEKNFGWQKMAEFLDDVYERCANVK